MKKSIVLSAQVLLSMSQLLCSSYSLQLHQNNAIEPFIPFIAEQRVTLFAEYPYLYQASVEDDMPYVTWFAHLPHSTAVIAYYDGKPIGLIAGTSFKDFGGHFAGSVALFENAHLNPDDYFYVSEVIIMPEHRRKGLSKDLFTMLEHHVKTLGYTKICFVTESHAEHPLKPVNYHDLDALWQTFGYARMDLVIHFSWPTLQVDGGCKTQQHGLQYWQKSLPVQAPNNIYELNL